MTPDPDARPQPSATLAQPPVSAEPADAPEPSRWIRRAELLLALGVVALGILILLETRDIRVARAMARVGPRVIPTIVGFGLITIGVWYAIEILRSRETPVEAGSEDVDPNLPADWRALAGIGVALVLYLLTIERLGFIIASAVMFVIAAAAMGSRQWLRDTAVAALLSAAVYVVFSQGLDVRLPQGVLDGVP
jgi:putative tricarboxylic transport membrane protein